MSGTDLTLWAEPSPPRWYCYVCHDHHPEGQDCPRVRAQRIAAAADARERIVRDVEESQRRKDRGQARALSNPEHERWRRAFREQVIRLAMSGDTFTSEDVTAVVGLPSGDVGQHRNNAVGALMSAMHRQGYIRPVTYAPSTRPESHAAVLRVWRGVDL